MYDVTYHLEECILVWNSQHFYFIYFLNDVSQKNVQIQLSASSKMHSIKSISRTFSSIQNGHLAAEEDIWFGFLFFL